MTALEMGYRSARITEPDVEILPGSVADIPDIVNLAGGERAEGSVTGARALLLAILEDAVRCYLSPRPKLRYEAERWIEGWSRGAAVSFETVCASFGLDVEAARDGLRSLREAGVAPQQVLRSRPNVRHNPRIGLPRRRRGRVSRPGMPPLVIDPG